MSALRTPPRAGWSRRPTGPIVGLLCVLLLLVPGAAAEDEAELPRSLASRIIRLARDLARRGLEEEVDRVLDGWLALGAPADDVAGQRKKLARDLARAKPKPLPFPPGAKAASRVAQDLTALLPNREGPTKESLARIILSFDDTIGEAHATLGHVEHDGRWVEPWVPAVQARRRAIQDALRRARTLEIHMVVDEASHPMLTQLGHGAVPHVYAGQLHAYGTHMPAEKLARIVREGLRARALSEWLRTGDLRLPEKERTRLLLGSQAEYLRAVDNSDAGGGLQRFDAQSVRRMGQYQDARGWMVQCAIRGEANDEARVLYGQYDRDGQPALDAGHLNWICLSFLGTRLPVYVYIDTEESVEKESSTSSPAERRERKEMMRLSKAGLSGARAWIAWLARRGEDPPFTSCMQNRIGKIQGTSLFKGTFVAEYLHETETFEHVWTATRPDEVGEGTVTEAFENAFGESMSAFESRWRGWLLPPEPGLAQRLASSPAAGLSTEEKALLSHLDEVRKASQGRMHVHVFVPVTLDDSLSAGCRLHARYLARNKDQLTRWPDAHEEYPDREGFTPKGNWAGMHSVIAPGAKGARHAIDRWLGTFFHRLPLLRLGLVRVGWANEKGIAMLDAGSMTGIPSAQAPIMWPAPDATDVPTRFVPEIPNPFPGQDQSAWGYPVTFQIDHYRPMPRIQMALYEGTPSTASLVDCLVTSPESPGNIDLVPDGATCLIPQRHLKSNTGYTVVVKGVPDTPEVVWKFQTGR